MHGVNAGRKANVQLNGLSTYLRLLSTVLCRSSIGVVQGGELYRHDSPHRSGSGGEGHQAGREEHQEGVSRGRGLSCPYERLKRKVREDYTITEKASIWAFSWLKAPTNSNFTYKTLC